MVAVSYVIEDSRPYLLFSIGYSQSSGMKGQEAMCKAANQAWQAESLAA
jgi:hypothetical protein